jgi:hypothetical protein
MLIAVLLTAALGVEQMMGFNEHWDPASLRGVVVLAIIYVLPGAIGPIVAVSVANWVQRWTLHFLGFLS